MLYTLRMDFTHRPEEATRFTIESVLENFGEALSSFEKGKGWRIELIAQKKPNPKAIQQALSGVTKRTFIIAPLKNKDWVKESEKGLKPISAGDFFIHGAHFKGKIPKGKKAFLIDAGMAFGTGRHETTHLCLHVLSALKAQDINPTNILDLGTGTGILGFAASYLFNRKICAVDNDRASVRIAKENAVINDCADKVRIFYSDGYKAAGLKKAAPFDLIIANILANPLIDMAPELLRHMAPGGIALLSGLMKEQETSVLQAHAAMKVLSIERRGNWSALLLQKRTKEKRR